MFNGIQPRKYKEVLRCLNATVREYPRGAHIVELGEQSHNTGVLLEGTEEENAAHLQKAMQIGAAFAAKMCTKEGAFGYGTPIVGRTEL